jgi:hypothetical protein
MDNPKPETTPRQRITGAFLTLRRLKLGAWHGILTAASALAAALAGGTVLAIVGKPIWLWLTFLWNLY